MAKFKVGFSKPTNMTFKWFAWIIMEGYGIPYDHVYVRVHSDSLDRDIIYQASGLAVNFMSPTIFSSINTSIAEFDIEISDEKYKAMMQFAIDNAGKAYGIKEAFGMGIVRICEIFGKKIQNPFRDGQQTYVCSELAGYILEEFAGDQIQGDVYDMSPKVVYDYLISLKPNEL